MQAQSIPARMRPVDVKALGAAVREVRARRGLSQEWLGVRSGIHRNYIGAVERAEVNPTFKTLFQIAGGLAVPLSTLVLLYERNIAEKGTKLPPPVASAGLTR